MYIENDKIFHGDRSFFVTELYTSAIYTQTYDLLCANASSMFINELFMGYGLAFVAMKNYVSDNAVSEIVIRSKNSGDLLCWIAEDLASVNPGKLKVVWNCRKNNFPGTGLYYYVMAFASAGKLFLEFLGQKKNPADLRAMEKITVVRSKASISKISKLDDVFMLYERIGNGPSVYAQFSLGQRLKWLTYALTHHKQEMRGCLQIAKTAFGPAVAKHCRGYYSVRIVHTIVYDQMIRAFFHSIPGKVFVTGNNLDRYAIVEETAAKEYGIDTVCVPHGLEYGFKLPHCFTGDTFYANSEYASQWLNRLYQTDKFTYDAALTGKLFTVPSPQSGERRVIFLTEVGENYINCQIIEALHAFLAPKGMELWVKLHPKDLKSSYSQYPFLRFEENYNKALCGNICVSRKSTALLEAVYNNSSSCAIVLIGKDTFEFENFPSLQHENIRRFESLDALTAHIETLL